MSKLTFLLTLLVGSFPPAIEGNGRSGDEPWADEVSQLLARSVYEIFESSCTKCHGSHLARPKARFGYVLDLARMATDPGKIVPFDPQRSELFRLVKEGQMPPPGNGFGPLSVNQVEAIRLWIALGAPSVNASVGVDGSELPTRDAVSSLPMFWRSIRWLGSFHPVSIHFPIALLLFAVVAELLAASTGRQLYESSARLSLGVAAITSVVSASLGWANAIDPVFAPAPSTLLLFHRWLGTGTAVWVFGTWLLLETGLRHDLPRWRGVYRIVLFLGGVAVVTTSFIGGAMVYGLDRHLW